jgi:hypothetical protein
VADRLRRGEPAITTCQVSKHITDKSVCFEDMGYGVVLLIILGLGLGLGFLLDLL